MMAKLSTVQGSPVSDSRDSIIEKTIAGSSFPNLLLVLLAISALLRMAVAFYMGNTVVELPGIFDQISYHNLALRVLDGHGFSFGELWWPITPANAPTAHWSFLYTLYLVGVYSAFGPNPLVARLLQAVIVGILHPYLTYRIGEKLFGKKIGLIAAGISVVYIYYIYYSAALMTEPFYITAILSALFFSMELAESSGRRQDVKVGVVIGISIGVAVSLRQVFLLFIPFLFLWTWLSRFSRGRSLPVAATVLSLLLIGLFIAPATLYNYSRFGRFVLLNTNSGYAFFWGNHPIYGARFIPVLPRGTYQALIPEELHRLDEAALDQELLRRGLQFAWEDPKRYISLSVSRIPAYFMFWPSPDSETLSNISRVASFGITWPFMLYGLILSLAKLKGGRGWLDYASSPAGLLMLFVAVYSAIHLLTWALIRYRLPVDAVLILFAALAVPHLVDRIALLRLDKIRSLRASAGSNNP